jgi:hypothetical protein
MPYANNNGTKIYTEQPEAASQVILAFLETMSQQVQ